MFEIELIIYIKIDLVLNNLQRVICHKSQPTNNDIHQIWRFPVNSQSANKMKILMHSIRKMLCKWLHNKNAMQIMLLQKCIGNNLGIKCILNDIIIKLLYLKYRIIFRNIEEYLRSLHMDTQLIKKQKFI